MGFTMGLGAFENRVAIPNRIAAERDAKLAEQAKAFPSTLKNTGKDRAYFLTDKNYGSLDQWFREAERSGKTLNELGAKYDTSNPLFSNELAGYRFGIPSDAKLTGDASRLQMSGLIPGVETADGRPIGNGSVWTGNTANALSFLGGWSGGNAKTLTAGPLFQEMTKIYSDDYAEEKGYFLPQDVIDNYNLKIDKYSFQSGRLDLPTDIADRLKQNAIYADVPGMGKGFIFPSWQNYLNTFKDTTVGADGTGRLWGYPDGYSSSGDEDNQIRKAEEASQSGLGGFAKLALTAILAPVAGPVGAGAIVGGLDAASSGGDVLKGVLAGGASGALVSAGSAISDLAPLGGQLDIAGVAVPSISTGGSGFASILGDQVNKAVSNLPTTALSNAASQLIFTGEFDFDKMAKSLATSGLINVATGTATNMAADLGGNAASAIGGAVGGLTASALTGADPLKTAVASAITSVVRNNVQKPVDEFAKDIAGKFNLDPKNVKRALDSGITSLATSVAQGKDLNDVLVDGVTGTVMGYATGAISDIFSPSPGNGSDAFVERPTPTVIAVADRPKQGATGGPQPTTPVATAPAQSGATDTTAKPGTSITPDVTSETKPNSSGGLIYNAGNKQWFNARPDWFDKTRRTA